MARNLILSICIAILIGSQLAATPVTQKYSRDAFKTAMAHLEKTKEGSKPMIKAARH